MLNLTVLIVVLLVVNVVVVVGILTCTTDTWQLQFS